MATARQVLEAMLGAELPDELFDGAVIGTLFRPGDNDSTQTGEINLMDGTIAEVTIRIRRQARKDNN